MHSILYTCMWMKQTDTQYVRDECWIYNIIIRYCNIFVFVSCKIETKRKKIVEIDGEMIALTS